MANPGHSIGGAGGLNPAHADGTRPPQTPWWRRQRNNVFLAEKVSHPCRARFPWPRNDFSQKRPLDSNFLLTRQITASFQNEDALAGGASLWASVPPPAPLPMMMTSYAFMSCTRFSSPGYLSTKWRKRCHFCSPFAFSVRRPTAFAEGPTQSNHQTIAPGCYGGKHPYQRVGLLMFSSVESNSGL